ncbi:hypothetical protein [Streptacidiphilus sp. MAP12-33]|uniref:hypothetical protein n=1 Tax=Streptacidiphilus sp. MAP12-33 TaxID=3156266 RepID=UPI003518DFEC
METLLALEETAHRTADGAVAATVCNQAALLASDVGAHTTARTWCLQHAAAYPPAAPLPAAEAIRALEPLVNLARLHIRASRGLQAHHLLTRLLHAISTRTATVIEGAAVPADLVTEDAGDQDKVRSWLWTAVLADGARALTSTGRWEAALAHMQAHHGIGQRLLDGRQIAVIAALTASDPTAACAALDEAEPREAWEHAVAACLRAWCRSASTKPTLCGTDWRTLADLYDAHEPASGLAVFDARLGLAMLDLTGEISGPAPRISGTLLNRAVQAADGHAAREILAHPVATAHATSRELASLQDMVDQCGLNSSAMPPDLRTRLEMAVTRSTGIIRHALHLRVRPSRADAVGT